MTDEKIIFSINTRDVVRINNFFQEIGFTPEYGDKELAASGDGQEVIHFSVPGFRPQNLEERFSNKWKSFSVGITTGIIKNKINLEDIGQIRAPVYSDYANNFERDLLYSDRPVGYILGSKCPRCGGPTDIPRELCLNCCQ